MQKGWQIACSHSYDRTICLWKGFNRISKYKQHGHSSALSPLLLSLWCPMSSSSKDRQPRCRSSRFQKDNWIDIPLVVFSVKNAFSVSLTETSPLHLYLVCTAHPRFRQLSGIWVVCSLQECHVWSWNWRYPPCWIKLLLQLCIGLSTKPIVNWILDTCSKVLATAKPSPKAISGHCGAWVLIGAILKEALITHQIGRRSQGRLSISCGSNYYNPRSGISGPWPKGSDAKASRW